MKKLLTLAFHHLGNRNTRCTGNHLGDFLCSDACTQELGLHLAFLRLFFSQLFLKFRQHTVLQLGKLFELSLAAVLFHLVAGLINIVTRFLRFKRLDLFFLPDLFQITVLLGQIRDFVFNRGQPFFTGIIGFFLHRLAFNL